jgi:hypothetical protein
MVKLTPSKLIRELGVIASGQLKILATCCVEGCLNQIDVVQTSAAESEDLKIGCCFYPCSFHQRDPEVGRAVALLLHTPVTT